MANEKEDNQVASFHVSDEREPFLRKDLRAWLMEDLDRLTRASRLLAILKRDPTNPLQVRVTDLFRHHHLALSEITVAAQERAEEDEDDRPHVKACSLCNALIEVEAARLVLQQGMETDLNYVESKVLQAPTDNDKWFGKPRENSL